MKRTTGIGAALLLVVATTGCGTKLKVTSDAMEPTLHDGETVRITSLGSRLPARGDLVLVRPAKSTTMRVVRRVIAVGGEKIELRSGAAFVNGAAIPEEYRFQVPATVPAKASTVVDPLSNSMEALTVPANQYFVLGDNRGRAVDSRHFGALKIEEIVGYVTVTATREET